MAYFRCPLFLSVLLFYCLISVAQENNKTTIINKKVEIIEYEYDYIYLEHKTSAVLGIFNSHFHKKGTSELQLFFDRGRNALPGFIFGIEQSMKINNWEFSTGIKYQQYNEKFCFFEYNIENIEIQEITGKTRPIEKVMGYPSFNSTINNLGYLVSPIILRYRPDILKQAISISIQGEMKYLLRSNYYGKFAINQPLIKVEGFNPYLFALNLSFAYKFDFKNNLSITIEPLYSLNINNQINTAYLAYKSNYSCINIYFSLKY
jgi:hypothetical protein